MKRGLFILLLSFAFNGLKGQADSSRLAKSAIGIVRLDSLSGEVYDALHPYKLIMIGEMHGTKEPAEFVKGLAELFTNHRDSVLVGFEIPSAKMKEFLKEKTERSVFNSSFFTTVSTDGRGNEAWAGAISSLALNPKVKIFFFDTNVGDSKRNYLDRDSLMYIKIKKEFEKHPSFKIITISGNIHNMLLPYKNENKVAGFLSQDKELNLADKICSLNHVYKSGTMINNKGKGLQLYKVDNGNTEYSKFKKYEDYLFLFPSKQYAYTGVLFTRNVNAAKLISAGEASSTYNLKETYNEEDISVKEYLIKELNPIRENFRRINSISDWDTVLKRVVPPAEKLRFYFTGKKLEKVISRNGDGINQELTEYYLLRGELSFVYEKYFDKEDNFEKPEIVETKYYFGKGKLLHMANSHDCGAPFADDYLLNEEKRIKKHFEQLLKFK